MSEPMSELQLPMGSDMGRCEADIGPYVKALISHRVRCGLVQSLCRVRCRWEPIQADVSRCVHVGKPFLFMKTYLEIIM